MFNIENKIGNIHYGENIIRKIVLKGIDQYEGRVIPYNVGRKLMGLVGMRQVKNITPNPNGAIKIINNTEETEEGAPKPEPNYEILVYLVVRFGTSITDVTNGLIDYIYEYCDIIINTKPTKVTVKVTGTLSKNLVKRDIEVSR
ncbi:MAG: hypothetical protein KBS66_02620 [Eubacterium sp.]|nr:hypothetical protein [Candidatus Colimonas fimequi]